MAKLYPTKGAREASRNFAYKRSRPRQAAQYGQARVESLDNARQDAANSRETLFREEEEAQILDLAYPWTLRLHKQNLVKKVINIPDSPPNMQAKQTWKHRQKVTRVTIQSLTRSKNFFEPPPLNLPLKKKMKSRYSNRQILLSLFLHPQRSTTATMLRSNVKQISSESTDNTAKKPNHANAKTVFPIRQEETIHLKPNRIAAPTRSILITIDLDTTPPTRGTLTKPQPTVVTPPKREVSKPLGLQGKPSRAANRKASSPIHSLPLSKHSDTIRHNSRPMRSGQPRNLLRERIFTSLVEGDQDNRLVELETSMIATPRSDPLEAVTAEEPS